MRNTSAESFLGVEHVLPTIGVRPNTEDLGLEALGIELDRGFIKTDTTCRTNVFRFYTTDDIAGPPCPAYRTSHEDAIRIETLAGVEGTHPLDRGYVPGCTYSRSQVASLDLTEPTALARGRPVRIGKFSYQSNGKVLASGETGGFMKTVFDAETGELLGAHTAGIQVMERVQGFGIIRHLEAADEGLLSMILTHPTPSKAMHESILAICDHPLHQ